MGPDQGPEEFQQTWLYKKISTIWPVLLPKEGVDMSHLGMGGFYNALVEPGFRIITTNTMWGYASNM